MLLPGARSALVAALPAISAKRVCLSLRKSRKVTLWHAIEQKKSTDFSLTHSPIALKSYGIFLFVYYKVVFLSSVHIYTFHQLIVRAKTKKNINCYSYNI